MHVCVLRSLPPGSEDHEPPEVRGGEPRGRGHGSGRGIAFLHISTYLFTLLHINISTHFYNLHIYNQDDVARINSCSTLTLFVLTSDLSADLRITNNYADSSTDKH